MSAGKGLVVLLVALCLSLGALGGWLLRAPPASPASYLAELTDDLGLRGDQVAQIDAILNEEDATVMALVRDHREQMGEGVKDNEYLHGADHSAP